MTVLKQQLLENENFIRLQDGPLFCIDLKYATQNNFTGKAVYENFDYAFLHKVAYEKIILAVNNLQKLKPNFRLKIFDALRPNYAQIKLWDFLAGTPEQVYVANPEPGSLHSFGFAVDLSIVNAMNHELDMGTEFDDFSELAQPIKQDFYLNLGKLKSQHIENRHLLKNVMESAGFKQLPFEWWHFDALDKATVIKNYKKIF